MRLLQQIPNPLNSGFEIQSITDRNRNDDSNLESGRSGSRLNVETGSSVPPSSAWVRVTQLGSLYRSASG